MTTLPERLQDVIAEMRSASRAATRDNNSVIAEYADKWADRLEAAQALQAQEGVGNA